MVTKLVNKKLIAEDTMAFYFEKPQGFEYLPGQFIYLTLPALKNDYRGPTRQFTLASSPTEEYLMIATRIRDESEFKQALAGLKSGEQTDIEGPSGTFILDEKESGNHVLLAGGIGITPFRSFIKYNIDKKLTSTELHLIYSNKIPELASFKDELANWSKVRNIKVDMCITRPKESKVKWGGLSGRIDGNMIRKRVTDYKSQNYWICGPPNMVDAMFMVLSKLKIPGKQIYSEKFSGY